jgi:hypothetical protein
MHPGPHVPPFKLQAAVLASARMQLGRNPMIVIICGLIVFDLKNEEMRKDRKITHWQAMFCHDNQYRAGRYRLTTIMIALPGRGGRYSAI